MTAGSGPRRAGFLARLGAGGLRSLPGGWAVFERDFVVLTSLGRYVALRTVVVTILAGIVFVMLATTVAVARSSSAAESTGRSVLIACFVTFIVIVQLAAPSLAADAIAGERAGDTLQIVLAAPVRPRDFVFAKFLSRLGTILVPIAGSIPVAGVAFLYGGVDPVLFFQVAACVGALAAMAVAGSILASAWARTVPAAVLGSYFAGIVLPWLATWFAAWFREDCVASLPPDLTGVLGWFELPGSVLYRLLASAGGRGVAVATVFPFLLTAGLWTLVCLALASSRIARESQVLARSGAPVRKVRTRWFRNPVLERATYGLPLRGGGWAGFIPTIVIGGLTWLIPAADGFRSDDVFLAGLNCCTWMTFFLVVAYASQSIASERQKGSFDLLLASPLDAREIVGAKLRAVALRAAGPLATGAALAITGIALDELHPGTLVTWGVTSGIALAFFAAFAMRESAVSSGPRRALGTSFGIPFGAMTGIVLLLLLLAVTGNTGEGVMSALSTMLPPVSVGYLTYATHDGSFGSRDSLMLTWSVIWMLALTVGAVTLARGASSALRSCG